MSFPRRHLLRPRPDFMFRKTPLNLAKLTRVADDLGPRPLQHLVRPQQAANRPTYRSAALVVA